ncbi:hypothetical protein GCM10007416_13070 [Kroppenstedtia guangzhouensis]|uniref:Uncharacterized protein n=1 Tax=Kroppenstedtia guangzhouensis TaxID=1274356 RepID=A0ABQ1GDC7_9BACL|nr:hypothetical protein GCM10007416_13070 [Kroppenstedtia guangzhouensis]
MTWGGIGTAYLDWRYPDNGRFLHIPSPLLTIRDIIHFCNLKVKLRRMRGKCAERLERAR